MRPVHFPRHKDPLVSVIVPVHNNARLTAACLNGLLRQLESRPVEVIVVDDGSTDGTAQYLKSCFGLQVITHVNNCGIPQSLNDGASVARGRFLHFLENRAAVTRGWIAPLLQAFELHHSVGAAASQIRSVDGRILEAGAVLWRDGRTLSYGRRKAAGDATVAYVRDVDYCSTSFMVRADVFEKVGGFSREFPVGCYADADLCFRIRQHGHRVVYQPESVVVHPEIKAAEIESRTVANGRVECSRDVFAQKWRSELARHFPSEEQFVEAAARRLCGARTALFIDSFIPLDDRSAGGRRISAIMQIVRDLGWHVIFVADDGGAYEPYTGRMRRTGIEVVPHGGDAVATLRNLPVAVDVAWICRPNLMQQYAPVLRDYTSAKIIYDTVDLHFVRLYREELVKSRPTNWQAMQALELSLARNADMTVVTGEHELRRLRDSGINAEIVPVIEPAVAPLSGFSERHDLLFLGNYTHAPNADAVSWMAKTIMPLVWKQLPDVRLILAGADPTPAVQRLRADRIRVSGYIPDISPVFERARVFVVPLRFGAGVKGKVVQSLAHGVPIVTTSIGAEGIGLTHAHNALIANDDVGFANAIVRLYNDETLWKHLSAQGSIAASRYAPGAVTIQIKSALNVE